MRRFIVQLVLAGFLAWLLSPVLSVVVPILPLDFIKVGPEGLLRYEPDWGPTVVSFIRFVIWSLGIFILFLIVPPVLSVLVPTARQYSVTKPLRRFQGYSAEIAFIGVFFLIFSILASLLFVLPDIQGEMINAQVIRAERDIHDKEQDAQFARNLDDLGIGDMERRVAETHAAVEEAEQQYERLLRARREEVWGNVLSQPLYYFGSVWLWSLVVALVIYGLSHVRRNGKSIRYHMARRYEGGVRFFQQGRFGLGGSARFAGLVEEWAVPFKHQKYGLFMGRSLYKRRLYVGLEDDRHMLTIAPTRSGKGTTAIIPNLLTWQGSAIVVDPKGENAFWTARYRAEKLGHRVFLLDPFNMIKLDGTHAFNPFDTLNPRSLTFGEDIRVVAEALVVRNPLAREPHWDDGAETIIAGIIDHLITSPDYPEPTLPMIRDLLSKPQDEFDTLLFKMGKSESPAGLARDAAARISRGAGTQEIIGLRSNADKHTEWLRSPAIQAALSTSDQRQGKFLADDTYFSRSLLQQLLKRTVAL